MQGNLKLVLIYIALIAKHVDYFNRYFLAIFSFFCDPCLHLTPTLIDWVVCFLNPLYILVINPVRDVELALDFPHSLNLVGGSGTALGICLCFPL